jgi:hypothetical protein
MRSKADVHARSAASDGCAAAFAGVERFGANEISRLSAATES